MLETYYKADTNGYIIKYGFQERQVFKRYDGKKNNDNAPVISGLDDNCAIKYHDKVYQFFVKSEYGESNLFYESSSSIESDMNVKGKKVSVLNSLTP